jgi:anthranilate phosphoribosyltransferase
LADGGKLDQTEARSAMDEVMDGRVSPVRLAAFLTALRVRGETPDEIAAFAASMRTHCVRLDAPEGAIDTCGTGGDGARTLNVSTLAALAAAGAGAVVAKHGNRSVSSSSGSADLLERLGVKIDCTPETAGRCLRETGFAFLFAPLYHPSMKHAMPVRRELGLRTVFNLLGPLCNPAGVRRQVVGIYSPALVRPICEALGELGAVKAMVVHSEDGLDEISPCAPTRFAIIENDRIREERVCPQDLGLEPVPLDALRVNSPEEAVALARTVLDGAEVPARRAVVLNAAAALVVAGRAADMREGVALAGDSLDSGRARTVLERAAALSRG